MFILQEMNLFQQFATKQFYFPGTEERILLILIVRIITDCAGSAGYKGGM